MRPVASLAVKFILTLAASGSTLALAQSDADCDPAPNYRGVALIGEQRDAGAGSGVVSLGDINGDGHGDFAVNAFQYAYQGVGFHGLTYVIYGNPRQLPISLGRLGPEVVTDGHEGFVIAGGGNLSGGKIAALGDVDGDGVDDFVIGVNNAGGPQGTFRGAIYLFHGRRAGSDAAAFPAVIDLADVATGKYGDQVGVHFSPTPLPSNSFYGSTVAALGDVNHDGLADFAVFITGRALIYFGQRGRPVTLTPALALRQQEPNGGLGSGLGGNFDFDADGINDVLVCDPSADPQAFSSGGVCYLVWGASIPNLGPEYVVNQLRPNMGGDGTLGLVFRGGESAVGLGFGSRVVASMDLNDDGHVDLVFGAPSAGNADDFRLQSGRVYVVYGSADYDFVELSLAGLAESMAGSDQRGFVLEGEPQLTGFFGESVASAGDVNGDGIDDLLIGAPGDRGCQESVRCGAAWVVYGRNGSNPFPPLTRISESTLTPELGFRFGPRHAESLQRFGSSVATLADMTGDGKPEWLIGAPTARIGDGLRGKACLYLSSNGQVFDPPPPLAINTGDQQLWLWLSGLLLVVGAMVLRGRMDRVRASMRPFPAQRIAGLTPAAISLLLVHIKRHGASRAA